MILGGCVSLQLHSHLANAFTHVHTSYWGQNSGGALGYSAQQNIDYYCQASISISLYFLMF